MPICARHTLVDLTPKYPTLVASTPGCLSEFQEGASATQTTKSLCEGRESVM